MKGSDGWTDKWLDGWTKEGKKEIFYLMMHSNHILFMVILHQTYYGKGPFG